jgi:hypothetical protein
MVLDIQILACPKQGFGYPTPYVFNDLRREVIGRFVNNREIVDHCFLFIIHGFSAPSGEP